MPFEFLRKSKTVGIDFRPNHVILTLLRSSFGKVRLGDAESHALPAEAQKEAREAQCLGFIRVFLSRNQANRQRVHISIPREKTLVRVIRLPAAARENLRKVLEYEMPKYTPFEKEEVYFDYQVIRQDKEWLQLIAVFARKRDLDPYLGLLKKAGIQPASIQVPSGAALNLFLYHQGEKGKEVSVLVDLNDPSFEMNILKGKDWEESLHLPLPREKREEKLLEIFARIGFPAEGLSKTGFYAYGPDAGGEKGIELSEPFLPPPLDRIEVPKGRPKPFHLYASIGLPLEGGARAPVSLNLLPMPMRKKVRQVAKPLFFVLLVVALGLAGGWALGLYQGYRNELDALRTEVKKKKPEVEAIERIQKKRGERAKENSDFARITSGEVSKVVILQELARVLPPTVWIWNLKCSGRELEISGFADSASELISLLDRSPLFEKVEFLAPVTKERERRGTEEKERERFKIKMRLEGAAST
jgi:Tfp pilus assembly protein PilN